MVDMKNMKEGCPLRLQSENLLIEELPNELMIFDPARNKAFCLNQTAAFVWRHANGKNSVAEIANRLAQPSGKPVDEGVVWFALEVLEKDGLLGSSMAPPPTAHVTRRDLLHKMGVGAIALPAVTVLFVSPAKAHASSLAPTASQNSLPPAGAQPDSGGFWKWLENLF